jgi:aminoglycoside phosphotransferase (APT) family kinase protein
MHDDELAIDEALVQELVRAQFPTLADLAVVRVAPWGTDNAVFRLGPDLVVRLPRIAWADGQPAMEDRWMPVLAQHLSVSVPEPVGLGTPSDLYPFAWSVHRWVVGDLAGPDTVGDPVAFADDIATVIEELRTVPIEDAPAAINRARPLAAYDKATRTMIEAASHLVDADAALALWEAGLAAAPYDGPPTWVHGDLEGNCIVNAAGRLHGLIDWGCGSVGDPAVDVQVAWSPLFTAESRTHLLARLQVDDATIARAKAAAINQACGALPYYLDTYPLIVERSRYKLTQLGVGLR